ncbi:MAG: aldolase [Candidatus Woesearchaeota archaeon]
MVFTKKDIHVPASVPKSKVEQYVKNYLKATRKSGNLFLFAGDQRVEHLHDDFVGPNVSEEDADPKHLFDIASKSKIGCFATQLGLLSRYGKSYPKVPYLVKLNSKSPLVKTSQKDPCSLAWHSIQDVVDFQKTSGLSIVGIGYTVYLGSEFENEMFREASQLINEAHKHGLICVLWMYPRGKAVVAEKDPHLIAGACNVAGCLGADFVKVNYPEPLVGKAIDSLKEAVTAAGRTKLVCAGGSSMDVPKFLTLLHDQIHIAGAHGTATGRNIHQKSLDEAISLCNAISSIICENHSVKEALALYKK